MFVIPIVISHCLSSTIVCHSPLSVIHNYLSFTIVCHSQLSVIHNCLSFTILCHSALSAIIQNAIPIVYHFLLSGIPPLLSITNHYLLFVIPYCLSFHSHCIFPIILAFPIVCHCRLCVIAHYPPLAIGCYSSVSSNPLLCHICVYVCIYVCVRDSGAP